jgi:hypothetical protein
VTIEAEPTKLTFTDQWIRSRSFRDTGQLKYWDAAAPGLGLKLGRKRKSWVVRYRPARGREREITIGSWPDLGLAEARRRAREHRLRAVDGVDPLLDRAVRRTELAPGSTFSAVLRAYWSSDPRHAALRRRKQEERLLENHVLPKWGRYPISDITTLHALDLLWNIAERYPIQANRVLHALRRPFRWRFSARLCNPVL